MAVITLEFADMDSAFKAQMVARMASCIAEIVELSGRCVELMISDGDGDGLSRLSTVDALAPSIEE